MDHTLKMLRSYQWKMTCTCKYISVSWMLDKMCKCSQTFQRINQLLKRILSLSNSDKRWNSTGFNIKFEIYSVTTFSSKNNCNQMLDYKEVFFIVNCLHYIISALAITHSIISRYLHVENLNFVFMQNVENKFLTSLPLNPFACILCCFHNKIH